MGAVTVGPFASFAQNGEDVVLWRALKDVDRGRYVDVGANHPTDDSVTRAFYDHGWRGIAIEPVPKYADAFRAERPEDIVIQAVVTDRAGETVTLHEVPDTGLSTLVDEVRDRHESAGRDVRDIKVATRTLDDVLTEAGWEGQDLHFVSIDTEGSEAAVLGGFDLDRWRPWILAIESTAPDSDEPTYEAWEAAVSASNYEFCLFDGLSRFYVAAEHRAELAPKLAYGACILDNYSTLAQRRLHVRVDELKEELKLAGKDIVRWRSAALTRWTDALAAVQPPPSAEETVLLQRELEAMRQTVSWRVTRPLRAVRAHTPSPRPDQ